MKNWYNKFKTRINWLFLLLLWVGGIICLIIDYYLDEYKFTPIILIPIMFTVFSFFIVTFDKIYNAYKM